MLFLASGVYAKRSSSKVTCFYVTKRGQVKEKSKKRCKGKFQESEAKALEYAEKKCSRKKKRTWNSEKKTCDKNGKSGSGKTECFMLDRRGKIKKKNKKRCKGKWAESEEKAIEYAQKKCAKKKRKTWDDKNNKCVKGGKSGNKYVDKINKYISKAVKRKKMTKEDVPESITKCIEAKNCGKQDFKDLKKAVKNNRKEAKCLKKGKVWVKKSKNGKYNCMKGSKVPMNIELIQVEKSEKTIKKCKKLAERFSRKTVVAEDGKTYYKLKHLKKFKKAGCLDYKVKESK